MTDNTDNATPSSHTVWTIARDAGPLTLLTSAVALGGPPLLIIGRPAFATLVFTAALAALTARLGMETTRVAAKRRTEITGSSRLGLSIGALAVLITAGMFVAYLPAAPLIVVYAALLAGAWTAGVVREQKRLPPPLPPAPGTRELLPGPPFGKDAEERLVLLMHYAELTETMKRAINDAADEHIEAFKERVEWPSLDLKTRGLVEGVLRLAKMIMPKSLTDEFAKPLTRSGYTGTQTTYTANLKPHDKDELARIRATMDPFNARTGKLKEDIKAALAPDISEAEARRRLVDIHKQHGFATPDDFIHMYTERLKGYQATSEYMQMVAHRPEEEAADAMPSDELVSPVEKLIQKVFEQLPPKVQRELPIFIADLSLALVHLRHDIAVPFIRARLEELFDDT